MNSSEKALIQWLHEHGITPSGCDGVTEELSSCMNALGELCRKDPFRFIGVCEEILSRKDLPKTSVVPLLRGMMDFLLLRIKPVPLLSSRRSLSSIEQEIFHFVNNTLEMEPVLADQAHLKAGRLRLLILLARRPRDVEGWVGEQMVLASHRDPESYEDDAAILSDTGFENLVTISETSVRGMTVGNVVLSAVALLKAGEPVPPLLSMLLVRLAKDPHSGVRIAVFKWLPFLAEADAERAWKLFDLAFRNRETLLARAAGPFLQQQYGAVPGRVRRVLAPLKAYLAMAGDGSHWGAVITRAFLNKGVTKEMWLGDLLLFKSAQVREKAFFLLEQETRKTDLQATALSGLIHLLAHLAFKPEIMNRIQQLIQRLAEQVEKSVPLANALITTYRGMETNWDMKWFYRFLETLALKTPAAACQLAESLLAYMETSDAFYRAWQGEECLTLLINMLKKRSIPENARRLLVKAQSIQRRSGTFSHV